MYMYMTIHVALYFITFTIYTVHVCVSFDRSSTGITVKMQRVWGSKGYAKEVPPVAIAIPPLTTITPTHEPQLPVGTAVSREEEGERGWEGEGERERSGSDGRVEREINVPPSRPLTAVRWYIVHIFIHGYA